jgi:hypothetical protein
VNNLDASDANFPNHNNTENASLDGVQVANHPNAEIHPDLAGPTEHNYDTVPVADSGPSSMQVPICAIQPPSPTPTLIGGGGGRGGITDTIPAAATSRAGVLGTNSR